MSYLSVGANFGTRILQKYVDKAGLTHEQGMARMREADRIIAARSAINENGVIPDTAGGSGPAGSNTTKYLMIGGALLVGLFLYKRMKK